MDFVNLTPHPIVVETRTSRFHDIRVTFPPSGKVARVSSSPGELLDPAWGIYAPPTFGEIENLPEPVEGTTYIVSSMVAMNCSRRRDVVAPGTGSADEPIRDAQGQITAVTRLIAASAHFPQRPKDAYDE